MRPSSETPFAQGHRFSALASQFTETALIPLHTLFLFATPEHRILESMITRLHAAKVIASDEGGKITAAKSRRDQSNNGLRTAPKCSPVAQLCYSRPPWCYSRMRFYGLVFLLSSSWGRAVRGRPTTRMSRGALSFARSRFAPLRWFDVLVKRAAWRHGRSIHSSQRPRNSRWNWDRRTVLIQIAIIARN
jgi:hypothetical protein